MSIAITGPARYIYQDKVILEQILRFWNNGVSCKYEPKDGEDATLRIQVNGSATEIELQVKGAEAKTASLTLKQLVKYLAHFPERSEKYCLLERLLGDSSRQVLIVCAQRATDECASLVKLRNWNGEPHENAPAMGKLAKELIAEVRLFKDGTKGSSLETRRALAMRALGSKTTVPNLREALCRLIVLEQWDEGYIVDCIKRNLTENHRIANDATQDVINRLLQVLQNSKGTGIDVVPELASRLQAASSPSVRPIDYVLRGCEQTWQELLSKDRAILLSGPPRCGKSGAACWVAAEYQTQGFSIRMCYSVEEADRVIQDQSVVQIVVVLDDPLGSGVDSNGSVIRAYAALSRIVGRVPMNRRLIVAQSQEALLASTGVTSLDVVNTGGKKWHNLSNYPAGFLRDVWSASVTRHSVSHHVNNLVADGIANGALLLGPGTLSHLAANADHLPPEANLEDVHALAVQSAQDFAISLCATTESKRIVRALAVGSSERESTAVCELAFMLGTGGEPKLPRFPGMVYSFGAVDEDKPELPAYEEEPRLSIADKDEVSILQQHCIVTKASLLRFTHPFYRTAARAVVGRSTPIERDELLTLVNRGLLCLSPECSAAAARNLRWLYADLNSSVGLNDEIINVAENGLRWYFPVTRDLCYEFLLGLVEREPAKYGEKLGEWVNAIFHVGIDDLVWHGETPFIPEGMEQSRLLFPELDAPTAADISAPLYALRNGEPLPIGPQAINLLKYFRRNPDELDHLVMGRLLSYGEGLIRGAAAATWVSCERNGDEDILTRICQDTHPKVVADTVKSALTAWPQYGEERQHSLMRVVEPWCERPETAAAVLKVVLAHFNDDDELFCKDDAATPKCWNVFAEFFHRAIQRFPISFWLSDTRMYSVCQEALQHLPEQAALNVASAWAEMLDRKVREGRLPSDFELGTLTSVIDSPVLKTSQRMPVIERLLSIPSTGAALVFIAEMTDEWGNLTEDERVLVKDRLSENRPDSVWLQASVLTRAEVPSELERTILGGQILLTTAPSELARCLPPSLLTACINLYRGDPQPLWYLGKHHPKSDTWKNMVRYLASTPDHALFEECIAELVAFDEKSLLEVIPQLNDDDRERVFNYLIEVKVGIVGEWHQELVDHLLNAAPNEDALKRMQKQMTSRAVAVLESVSDIAAWTTHGKTREALIAAVKNDFIARVQINKVYGLADLDQGRAKAPFTALLDVVKAKAPVLHDTYSELKILAKKVGVSVDVLNYLEEARLRAVNAYHEAEERMRKDRQHTRLPDWVGPG